MPAALSTRGRHSLDPLPDTGCRLFRRCQSCPLVECFYLMPAAQRRELLAAWTALAPFVRADAG